MADDTHTDNIGDRIDALLADRGLTARELSMRVSGKPDLIRDIKRRGHAPNADNLMRIAQELDTTVEHLMGDTKARGSIGSEVELSDKIIEWRGHDRAEPGIPLMGTGDCAAIKLKDDTGHLVAVERASFDDDYPVRMIARPPALRGARDLYAIHFVGDSMEPRYQAGEVAIVNPHRPVTRGDYVLVQLTDGEDAAVTTVLAKRLVNQNTQELVLEQFNPHLTFVVPKSRVARMHRILPQTELLFG